MASICTIGRFLSLIAVETLTLGAGTVLALIESGGNYDLCNKNEVSNDITSNYDHTTPYPTYPTSLGVFSLTNHPKCSYEGPNVGTVGTLACDDGYQASCIAYSPS